MKIKKTTNNPERVKRVRNFLDDSAIDYIAARVLFLSQLPQQAAILSSTAIEKCFKGILAFTGNESHGHLKKAHWNSVKNFDKNLYDNLNPDFLQLNQKVYQLRYTDDLPPNYNIVIASKEYLAELDHTILSISKLFQFGERDENYRLSRIESLIEDNDSRIINDNHIINKQNKEEFIYKSSQHIYELRRLGEGNIIEIYYWSKDKPDNPSFLRSGVTPNDSSGRQFKLAFPKQEA